MAKKEAKTLDLYVAHFEGILGFNCAILAENLVDADEILKNKMQDYFSDSEPSYRIIGPIELKEGLAFTIDFNGELYLNTRLPQFKEINPPDDCMDCGDGIEVDNDSNEIVVI